ncbi:hypothetical protein ES707_07799 [subsurface metagenome]
MAIAIKQKVNRDELAELAGYLSFLKGMVDIERKIDGKESYKTISQTMEDAITECSEIADRILYVGIEEAK